MEYKESIELTISDIIQRIVIFVLIYIACFHICRVWLNSDWDLVYDIICALPWSLNVFYLRSFRIWFFNIK